MSNLGERKHKWTNERRNGEGKETKESCMRACMSISNGMARVFNQYQLPKSVLSNKTANIMPYLGRVPFEQVWIELATIA